MFAFDSQRTDV